MAQYIIKKGDNLSTVAKKNGVKLKDLLSINKINNPDYIQAGQKINLPDNKPNFKGTNYTQFSDDYNATPKWDKITPNAGNSKTIKSTSSKQVLKSKSIPVKQNDEPGFLDSMKNKIYETYQDVTTAIDQQTSKKVVAKPKVKIDDSFINYGYKELGTYKDESFKAGKKDSLLSAMNVFDNDKGFDYIVSPKVKEGKKTFNNVKGVAHFLMDSDITPNQKYTTPYIEKGNNIVKSAQAGKFTPYLGTSPDDYVMYYKNTGNDKVNVKYGQLKDKDKYKGYEQIKVRSVPFGELDFNNKKSAGFAKKASYIGTLDGKQTSIITDPESNDVYGRFSGGSGIFHFKEPKTGKTISVDVSGSVNIIKMVGEQLVKKYNVHPANLQFLYHDMGSYSAKPKSHNGVLSNEQWENYNSNNKGYSGAALMYPMEHGGKITEETIYSMGEQPKVILTPDDIKAESGFNIGDISNEGYINNAYDKQMPIIPSLEQLNTLNKFKGVVNKYGEEEAFNKGYYEQPDIALTKGLEDYYYKYGRKKGNFSGNEVLNYLNSKPYLPQPQIKKGSYIEQFKEGGYAKDGFNYQDYMPMERDIPVDTTTSYNRDIDRFAWRNTLQNLPEIQKQQQVPNQQIDSSYYTTKTPKGYFNVYDKQNQLVGYSMDNKTVIKQEPNFEEGGIIQAWIQKFSPGGTPKPYITPYTNFPQEENPVQGFTNLQNNQGQGMPNNGQELMNPTSTYGNYTGYEPNNFANNRGDVNIDPIQPMGTTKLTTNTQDLTNKQQASVSKLPQMGGGMPPTNPADAILDGVNMVGDIATGAIGAFAKPDSKASAYAQGSAKAQSVVKPLEKIPILGQASKLFAGIIGGALEARRKGIENEETDKQNNQLEYLTRNTQSVSQPSYYGQYMAKYGANPKMMEQRVIDDIYSDFDKYLKLT